MSPVSLNPANVAAAALSVEPAVKPENTPSAAEVACQWVEKTASAILATSLGQTKSIVLSPVSVAPVLGMLLVGIEDQARKEGLLGLAPGSLTPELEADIHRELGAFSRAHPFAENSAITTVNFLTSSRPPPSQLLIDTLQDAYHTEVQPVDPFHDIAKATDDYVARKTGGHITNAFGDTSKNERDRVVLALGNILNFQGIWEEPFDKKVTCADNFDCADGSIITNVELMHLTGTLRFARHRGFEAVAKSFQSDDGQPLKLVAIHSGDTNTGPLFGLTNRIINNLITMSINADEVQGSIVLPRIQINHTDKLLLAKQALATNHTITPQDLSGFHLDASDILNSHSTINVSLDEAGVKGSVVTLFDTISRSGFSLPQFVFDRPGYFAIVDDSGSRLVEAVISDGQFLVTHGPARITPPPSDIIDALLNANSPVQAILNPSRPVVSQQSSESTWPEITTRQRRIITETVQEIEAWIQNKLNPEGELNICRVSLPSSALRIGVKSLHEAEILKTRILQLIGEEYARSVSHYEFASCGGADVILSIGSRDRLIECLSDSETPVKPVINSEPKSKKNSEPECIKSPPNLVALLQSRLNPHNELKIIRVSDISSQLRLEVKSRHEAEILETRIVQIIGKEYADAVHYFEFESSKCVDVILYVKAKNQLLKCLSEPPAMPHKNSDKTKPVTHGQPDIVALVQNNLNPKGELNILRVLEFSGELSFNVNSRSEAETLLKRTVQLIGDDYADAVSFFQFKVAKCWQVILSARGAQQFFKCASKPVVNNKTDERTEPVVTLGQPELVALVQKSLNPKNELSITHVYDFPGELHIRVKSRGEAETLIKQTLQLIGEKYADSVSCFEFKLLDCVEVILSSDSKKQLFEYLNEHTSKPDSSNTPQP